MTDRTTARVVGALFIVATVAAIVGGAMILPIEDGLAEAAAKESQIVTGALIELVLVLSVVGIATMVFPILKRRSAGLALSYAGSRTIEAVLLLAATVHGLAVLSLALDDAGTAGTSALYDTLLAGRDWTYLLGSMVLLGVSTLIFNSVLLRGRLVPAWLSAWGLVGGALILVRGLIEMYGTEFSGWMQAVLAAPIGLQEMVLAVLLIARGFTTEAA